MNAMKPLSVSLDTFPVEITKQYDIFGELSNDTFVGKTRDIVDYIVIKRRVASNGSCLREEGILKELKGIDGFPTIEMTLHNHTRSNNYCYIVMNYLGCTFTKLHAHCPDIFTPTMVTHIATGMIDCLRSLHSKKIIHGDIQPDHFLIGIASRVGAEYPRLFLIDFDKSVRLSEGPQSAAGFSSLIFSSVRLMQGKRMTMRDDLESLAYTIMYFLLDGKLPWATGALQALMIENSRAAAKAIAKMKMETNFEKLCANFPPEIASFVKYARSSSPDKEVDYECIWDLFAGFLQAGTAEDELFCYQDF